MIPFDSGGSTSKGSYRSKKKIVKVWMMMNRKEELLPLTLLPSLAPLARPACPLARLLARPLPCLLTLPLSHSLARLLAHSPPCPPLARPLAHPLTHLLARLPTRSLTCLLARSLACPPARLPARSSARPLVCLPTCPLAYDTFFVKIHTDQTNCPKQFFFRPKCVEMSKLP